MAIQTSHIVRSTDGRDSGALFFVVAAGDGFVHLADGKRRKLENPKRKKLRHICFEADGDSRVAEKLKNGEAVTNSELRRALAQYRVQAKEQEAK